MSEKGGNKSRTEALDIVLKNRRTLATTASYSASTTSTIALPRDFLVQRVSLFIDTNQKV